MYSQEVPRLIVNELSRCFKYADEGWTEYKEIKRVKIYLECVEGGEWGEEFGLPSGRLQYLCFDFTQGWTRTVKRKTQLKWQVKTARTIRKLFKAGMTPGYMDFIFKYDGDVSVRMDQSSV